MEAVNTHTQTQTPHHPSNNQQQNDHDDIKNLTFLTLNCWGLKYVSSHRLERIHAIADFLASASSTSHSRSSSSDNCLQAFTDNQPVPHPKPRPRSQSNSTKIRIDDKTGYYDVVALQELWVYHDFLVIRDRAKEGGLIYSKWFHSAALGAGLAILSRYPIIESHFYAYALNGHPLHFIQGDFFVGKAVGSCLLDVPSVGAVEVFSTHLYAPHDVPAPEWKRAHRTAQAWELAKLVRASAERGRAVFVCGDLNSVPSSLPITILAAHGQLHDAWSSVHPARLPTAEASYRKAIKDEGITCDSLINTFTAAKKPTDRGPNGFGKRLDYVMFRSNRHTILCDDCHVTLTEPIPVFGYSYSDHFALQATFSIFSPSSSSSSPLPPPPRLMPQQLQNAVSALMTKFRASQRTSTTHLCLFGLCLLMTPAIAVAASFQPLKFLNWIFTLLSIFVGGFGITMFYCGFLAGNWERSALKEVCEEMELVLQRLDDDE